MNARDYVQWCELAGLYLANVSHFDRYRTYAPQISPAGLNTVIVSEFLADNDAQVDVTSWRTYSVYEMNPERTQRVAWTAAALEAIGASRLAAAVRSAKSHSPFEAFASRDLSNMQQIHDALKDVKVPEMLEHLQQSIAHMLPDAAAAMGVPARSLSAAQAQAGTPDYESREELVQLLDRYVTVHQDELQADLDRHGDPRTQPGYTRKGQLQELERRQQLRWAAEEQLADVRRLKEHVDAIRQKIDKLKKSSKGGELKADSLRRKLLEVVKRNKRRPADEIIPEMRAALAEVETFLGAHPELVPPDPIGDQELKAQLAAWGEYDTYVGRREASITWERPRGFECSWTVFSLAGYFSKNKPESLRALLRAIERLQQRIPQLIEEWRERVIAHFRDYEGQMHDWELEDYEQDAAGEVTDASILQHAGKATIVLRMLDDSDEAFFGQTFFAVEWDEEHGLEIAWEDEPSQPTALPEAAFSLGSIEIVEAHRNVNAEDLAQFERRFGVQLPREYRQFLLVHNGGRPRPNHVVFKSQGARWPADVGRFFSVTGSADSNPADESLEAATEAARSQGIPASLLPIATIEFLGQMQLAMPSTLFLALSGKRKGHVLAVHVEQLAGLLSTAGNQIMRGKLTEQVLDMSLTAAKSLQELFGRLVERPRAKLPRWLQMIREDDVAGLVGWLDGGGKLDVTYRDYGSPVPLSLVDYLAQDASPALLQELLKRHAFKPKALCESWQRLGGDVNRFRQLMEVLPTTLWSRVLVSSQVWDQPDVLEQLATAGADFNAPVNDEGAPPIHLAVQAGNKEGVRWLIAHGADVQKPDRYQRTAFIYAETGPGFECLPILEGKDENASPVGQPSPDAPGIGQLWQAAQQLAAGVGLTIGIQIKSPPVTRVEKAYYNECHYLLWIDVRGNKVTFKDMNTPRQDYLYAAEWPTFLFAPILQWPDLRPLWDTLEVRELDWQKAMKKRNYQGPLRPDLTEAARNALEQAFRPEEAAARGIRLHK
jgi:hypothetical protein